MNLQSAILLLIAGVFEISMAVFLKNADGFKKFWPSVLGIMASNLSILFLDLAARQIPISVAYPLWTGMGAVGSLLITLFYYKEPLKKLQQVFWALLVLGMLGIVALLGIPPAQRPGIGIGTWPRITMVVLGVVLLGIAARTVGRLKLTRSDFRFGGYMILAGGCECTMALALKASDGWTRLWPSVLGIVGNNASVVFLTLASIGIPMSVAYPVWTGLGAVGSAFLAIIWFGEPADPLMMVSLFCALGGLMGLAAHEK